MLRGGPSTSESKRSKAKRSMQSEGEKGRCATHSIACAKLVVKYQRWRYQNKHTVCWLQTTECGDRQR